MMSRLGPNIKQIVSSRVRLAFLWLTLLTSLGVASTRSGSLPPTGLTCELMPNPQTTVITDRQPEFSWIVNSPFNNECQSAYQILLASSLKKLEHNEGDMWDSGKVQSRQSVDVRYNGKSLKSCTSYFWKVRTWDSQDQVSAYSRPQQFRTGTLSDRYATARYPLQKREVEPTRLVKTGSDKYFIDFGRAAFGTVRLTLTNRGPKREIEVHLGEVSDGDTAINRQPGGTRRYRKMSLLVEEGTHTYIVNVTPDKRNTGTMAVKMPPHVGEVMPFRYCEIENWPAELGCAHVRQIVVHYPFNDYASKFQSSSRILNDVWELCKYSIKATSFCGVYVDGDRERIPYEADAYINQLCHYCVDREYTMGRYSHEYLITHPTWPTEWILHSVLMAWADYMYTGNAESVEHYYEDLKAKTLLVLAREDGLISVNTGLVTDEVLRSIHFEGGKLRDIVDWPHGGILGLKGGYGQTDNFEFMPMNTVINAFHYRALTLMSEIPGYLGKQEDAEHFRNAAIKVKRSFNLAFLNKDKGIYVDGQGSDHSSLHANMYPLAFGLVPEKYLESVVAFIKSRGMACSVYGSQYLLEALYNAGEDHYALKLITDCDSDRSWPHMIYEVGTTITTEAWDDKYKPNQDWNHAWGAAPSNIIPRFLMGVQPLEPGFATIQIKPQVGGLKNASLDLPTIRGTIHVDFDSVRDKSFTLNVRIPANSTARVFLPKLGLDDPTVLVDNVPAQGAVEGKFIVLDDIGSGTHSFERRR